MSIGGANVLNNRHRGLLKLCFVRRMMKRSRGAAELCLMPAHNDINSLPVVVRGRETITAMARIGNEHHRRL